MKVVPLRTSQSCVPTSEQSLLLSGLQRVATHKVTLMLMYTVDGSPFAPTTSRHLPRLFRPGWTRVAEAAVATVRRVQRSMAIAWNEEDGLGRKW